MKIVREHINEKFSEGGDPIKDMNIGYNSLMKLERGDVFFQPSNNLYCIVLNIKRFNPTYARITYIPFSFKDKTAREFWKVINNIRNKTFDKSLYSVYTNDYNINEFDLIFKVASKEKLKNYMIEESINEAFKEDSDPIQDIGIGTRNFFEQEYIKLQSMAPYKLQNYFNMDKYDIADSFHKLIIPLITIKMLQWLLRGNTIDRAFQSAYNTWRYLTEHEKIRFPESSYVMEYCKKILKDIYDIEWNPLDSPLK